jgi:hypothetical protein
MRAQPLRRNCAVLPHASAAAEERSAERKAHIGADHAGNAMPSTGAHSCTVRFGKRMKARRW